MHEQEHPLGELRELLVEALDLVGAHPQDGIAVLANLRQRDLAPRAILGLAPGSWSCSWSIVVIVVVIVIVVVLVSWS